MFGIVGSMMKKVLPFLITFLFLTGAIWYVNQKGADTIVPSMNNTTPGNSEVRAPKSLSWTAIPAMTINQSKKYTAVMETSKGNMTFELFAKDAPQTVNNFVFLSKEGFY